MEKLLKVFKIRIDNETKNGYSENMEEFTVLSESFEEAILEAKKRIKSKDGECIGKIELFTLID